MTPVTPSAEESPCLADSKEHTNARRQRRQSQNANTPHRCQGTKKDVTYTGTGWNNALLTKPRHRSASVLSVPCGRRSHHMAHAGRWCAHTPVRLQANDPIPSTPRTDKNGFGWVPYYALT